MALYELSIDAALVREAEKVVSLEDRGYPTLVMRWDSRLFDQPWQTTIVLDYQIVLPPLVVARSTFNEVKVAAFVDGAPTKFLYFGTEMNANVPRIAPAMENSVAPSKLYQEFRLEEQTCPLPYLKLIQSTPRIFGNGPQDYYSPPITVERYDGVATIEHLADLFPMQVANLDMINGSLLADPAFGFWNGARYIGVTSIAILREGKVVGMHQRVGRTDKEPMPPEIKRRDPNLDVRRDLVAIDIGAYSTVVATRGEKSLPELLRIGGVSEIVYARDYESPSEIGFENLGQTVKAWRSRVILPLTQWGDVVVGQAAREMRMRPGHDQLQRVASTIPQIPLLRERTERKTAFRLRGLRDPDSTEMLKTPAPPVVDEEGIGSHIPFDPIELYAYYLGLNVNHRTRGLHLRYALSMPVGWSPERRKSVLVAFRRGIFRSLPIGLVEYHDVERLEVVDAGPSVIPFSVHALRVFNLQPKLEPIVFATIDAGASETAMLFGVLRPAKSSERSQGHDLIIEHLEPRSIPWLGGERILHRLAYRCYVANLTAMREANIPIERPDEEEMLSGGEDELVTTTPEARANTVMIMELLRPLLEEGKGASSYKSKLISTSGNTREFLLEIDRDAFVSAIDGWIREGVRSFKTALDDALVKIGRAPDPHKDVRVILGGRLGMHSLFGDELEKILPADMHLHRFKEPGKKNMQTPTVKTSVVLGILNMKYDRVGAIHRSESRDPFRFRVGRSAHGQLADVLDPSVDYDEWREMGACTKPDIEILYMAAVDVGDVAAGDPRVKRKTVSLGEPAIGQRIYVRAVAPEKVEVSVGPPGGEPEQGAPSWTVDVSEGS